MLWRVDHVLLWPALILSSSFVMDASLTLLTRMLRGRRWYTAHREHLYQWLARCGGGTHARAGAAYLGWNLLEIGKGAGRERVCQYGEISGVAVSLKKKKHR